MGSATTDRPQVIENITVMKVGEYGVLVGEKLWYGVNKPLTPANFAPGSYKVSLTVAKTGKKYINSILGVETAAPATPPATPPAQAPVNPPVQAPASQAAPSTQGRPTRAGYDKPLTDYDLAKDKQIGRAGIIQAAMQSPGPLQWSASFDEYIANVRKLADFGVHYSQE